MQPYLACAVTKDGLMELLGPASLPATPVICLLYPGNDQDPEYFARPPGLPVENISAAPTDTGS
jgi:hypothetical protein